MKTPNSLARLFFGILLTVLSTGVALGQPSQFAFTQTSSSGALLGKATIDGTPAESGDWVAARDSDGNIAGAAALIINAGEAYINLPIYGDDSTTSGVDEGMNGGEAFSLVLWDSSTGAFIDLGQDLSGWQNTNGSPIPTLDDPNRVFDFVPASGGSSAAFPITVTDGTNSATLNFGIDPAGTDGLDSGLDQPAPPPPPSGFDARFTAGTEAFLTDIRRAPTTFPAPVISYTLEFKGDAAIVLSWNASELAQAGSFRMKDNLGLGLLDLDMTGVSTFDTSTNATIASLGKVLIEATFAEPPAAPTAVDDSATVDEDASVVVDVLSNDTDPNGGTLTITGVSAPSNGSAADNGDGTITYTPDADYNGSDSFDYTVSNGSTATATVSITVDSINDDPVAADDAGAGDEDTDITIDVLANDADSSDPGDVLSVTSVTDGTNGTVVDNGDGTVTYSPDADFNGSDTFTYTIGDGNGGSSTASVAVTVNAVADAPVAEDDTAEVDEDGSVSIPVLDNDSDADGDALTVTANDDAGNGALSVDSGSVVYTPAADFNGSDTFTYTVSDGDAGTDDATATVTVTVNSVNDDPVAQDDTGSGTEDADVVIDVLSNDSDAADPTDVLSVTAVEDGSNGTVVDNGDGTVTYTPEADFNGTDSFAYTIGDGNGGTATADVTVTLAAVNDDPVAVDDFASTTFGVAVTISPLDNDTDVDGDTITLTAITQPAKGAAVDNLDGTVTYTPGGTFDGQDEFTYTISDGNGGSDTGTITVTALNAVADDVSTDEDTAISFDPTANDEDPQGDSIVVTGVGTPANGVATFDGNDVTYTPNDDFNGSDTFTYTIQDVPASGAPSTATGTVSVTVNAVNDAPVAVDDTAAGDEDTSIDILLLDNDTDVEGDALSISSNTDPSHGALAPPSDAVGAATAVTDFVYTPDADFNGEDSFDYTISDGNGGTSTGTVVITVNPVQDAPVTADDTGETSLDRAVDIDVLANDSDADNEPLTITIATAPANGTATVDDNGTPAEVTDDHVTYMPNAGYFNLGDGVDLGPDTFVYEVTDGTDVASATVSVTVLENNPPTTVDDSATVAEDGSVSISPLTNDSDPDNEALTLGALSDPPNGTATGNADGSVTYAPDANYNGSDTFTYEAVDERGGTTVGTISITISAVNDAPRAVPDQLTLNKNTSASVAVLANDQDVDGDTVMLTSAASPANGTATANSDGTVTYTPNEGYFGSDSFEYVATDGSLSSRGAVQVTVLDANTAPTATDDAVTTDEDTSVDIDLLANDTDPDGDDISVTSVGTATNGTLVDNGDGTVTYSPNTEYNGSDSFTYTITDPEGEVSTATVTITVNAVNDAPVATDDTRKAFEGTTAAYTPLDNDTDPESDDLEITGVGTPGLGMTSLTDTETIAYEPPAGFSGTDTFTYEISDGNGGVATGTVTVTVEALPVDDDGVEEATEAAAPNNGDGNGDGMPDSEQANVASLPSASTGTFITVASDPGSELVAVTSTATNPTSEEPPAEAEFPAGFLEYELTGGTGNAARTVSITLEDGEFNSYFKFGPTPDNTTPHWYNFIFDGETGAVIDGNSITLHFVDGKRGDDDLTLNGTIVDPGAPAKIPNEAPVAKADAVTTDEDTAISFDVVANDTDEDGDDLTIASATRPSSGKRVLNGNLITYTPNPNFNGTDSFSYVVSDGKGGSVSAKVTLTVVSVNDPPIAVDDAFTTEEDAAIEIVGLILNDTDVESSGLTLVQVQAAKEGLIAISNTGKVTYTPPKDFSGSDRFTYTVSDGTDTSIGAATVIVTPVNDAPVANMDMVALEESAPPTSIDVLANDSDVEGDDLTITEVGEASHGTATVQGDGTILYTPGPTFTNQDTFTYTVSDPSGATAEGTVAVALGAVAPNALADEGVVDEDNALVIDVLANDVDANGDTIEVTSVGDASNGNTAIDAEGNIVYTPNDDFNGTDSFSYEVSDGGLASTATVTVTVNAVNDAPEFDEASPVFVAPTANEDYTIGSNDENSPAPRFNDEPFEFNAATDAEGTSLTYTWEASTDADLSSILLTETLVDKTVFDVATSNFASIMSDSPGDRLDIFHRVTASDGELETESAIESITLVRGYIVGTEDESLPEEYDLYQNYPNPFNPMTSIRMALPAAGRVTLEVFDVVGRRVASLVEGQLAAGYHEIPFDGSDLPSGVYIYLMRTDGFTASRRLVLLK